MSNYTRDQDWPGSSLHDRPDYNARHTPVQAESRPANAEKCAGCQCAFGKHYTSFDKTSTGCSAMNGGSSGPYDRDYSNPYRCSCKGFYKIHKYQ